MPLVVCAGSREMRIEQPAGIRALALAELRVGGQRANRLGEQVAAPGGHGNTAVMFLHQSRELAIGIADEADRPRRGRDAVELARHHQAFHLRPQAHQVQIGRSHRIGEVFHRVVRLEMHVC